MFTGIMSHELPIVGSTCYFIFTNKSTWQSQDSVVYCIRKKSSECRGFLPYVQILHLAGKKKKDTQFLNTMYLCFTFSYSSFKMFWDQSLQEAFHGPYALCKLSWYSFSLCHKYQVHNSTVAFITLPCNFIYSCFICYTKSGILGVKLLNG